MTETRAERAQRDAEAYLDRAFQFLVDDFGYDSIGRIPVTTERVVVRGYINRHAGIQVELSGVPPGETFLGGLRKLKDGVPVPYDDEHFLTFENIALVRRGAHDDLLSHNLNPDGWRGVVNAAVSLVKDNRLLLIGDEWISGDRVRAAWNRHFEREFGFTPDPDGNDAWPMGIFKSKFAFLFDRGFRLVFDTTTLTPHEYLVARELRYESGPESVRIHCADLRDDDWEVTRNGRPIGNYFHATPEEIEAVARLVEAEFL